MRKTSRKSPARVKGSAIPESRIVPAAVEASGEALRRYAGKVLQLDHDGLKVLVDLR